MVKYTAAETTDWVARSLRQADKVSDVEVLADQVLRVSRSQYDPFVAGIVSATRVEATTVRALVESRHRVEIIAIVPKESYWTGEALRLAHGKNIATGAYADLLRVIRLQNVRAFQPRDTVFVERGLHQHDRVSSFERIHDRLYRISRCNGLPDLTAAMLSEYELTAEHLRTARDRYGRFSVAVITNPYGEATSAAQEAARTMGCEILKWSPFLLRLNKK